MRLKQVSATGLFSTGRWQEQSFTSKVSLIPVLSRVLLAAFFAVHKLTCPADVQEWDVENVAAYLKTIGVSNEVVDIFHGL